MESSEIRHPFEQLFLSFLFLAVPVGVSFWTITGMLDQYSELRWFLIYAVSILLLLGSWFSGFRVFYPDFRSTRGLFPLLLGAAIAGTIPVVRSFPGTIEIQLLEWICFGVLCLWSFSLAREEQTLRSLLRSIRFANALGLLAVGGYLIAQQWGIAWSYLAIHPGQVASLFGNKNFAASFFAVSTLLHLWTGDLAAGEGRGFRRFARGFPAALGVYGLVSMKARGASFGFLLGAMLWVWPRIPGSRKVKGAFAGGLFGIALLLAVFYGYRGITDIGDSRSIRLIRWWNTSAMIGEHPWGVGPGRYEFDYIPFSQHYGNDPEITETNTSKSPHNLPLQIAAEYGVLTMILSGAALIWMLLRARKARPESAALLACILVDGFFAFPFQVPYTFFVFAVFLGIALSGAFPARGVPSGGISGVLRGLCAAAALWITVLFTSAVLAESYDMNDELLMRRACTHAPWRPRACLSYAAILGNQRRFSEGVEVMERQLLRVPHLFPAYFILSELYRNARDPRGYCDALRGYDETFQGRSSVHGEWLQECSGGAP